MIKQVYYQAESSTSDWDGSNDRSIFGEESYYLGEEIGNKSVTCIEWGEHIQHLFIDVYLDDKIYCSIPMEKVCRVYYD